MKISKKIVISVATAAFLSITGIGVWAYAAPYSYVSLDVNPSIEYTLNVFDRVIGVKAVNDDGQEILVDIGELKNLTIEDAITKTVDELAEEGYLLIAADEIEGTDVTETVSGSAVDAVKADEAGSGSDEAGQATATDTSSTDGAAAETGTTVVATNGNSTTTPTTDGTTADATAITNQNTDGTKDIIVGGIVITVSNKDIELTDDLVNKIRDAIESAISQEVEVEVMGVGYARVQEARRLGVTPGKLNLVEKLKASSSNPDSIEITEWVNKPVKEIMQAIKENKKAKTFSTAIRSDDTSAIAKDNTTASEEINHTVTGAALEKNMDDNKADEVTTITLKWYAGNASEDKDDNENEDADDNEDEDNDQDEDYDDDRDDNEDDDEDEGNRKYSVRKADKDDRKATYHAIKKAEKDSKKEAMKAAKEESRVDREKIKEAKREAKEAAKEAREAMRSTEETAKKAWKEASEDEDNDDQGEGERKYDYSKPGSSGKNNRNKGNDNSQ